MSQLDWLEQGQEGPLKLGSASSRPRPRSYSTILQRFLEAGDKPSEPQKARHIRDALVMSRGLPGDEICALRVHVDPDPGSAVLSASGFSIACVPQTVNIAGREYPAHIALDVQNVDRVVFEKLLGELCQAMLYVWTDLRPFQDLRAQIRLIEAEIAEQDMFQNFQNAAENPVECEEARPPFHDLGKTLCLRLSVHGREGFYVPKKSRPAVVEAAPMTPSTK